MRLRTILLFALTAIMTNTALAQKGEISGRVIDKQSNRGIEYASVVLLNPTDSSMVPGIGAMTAKNGSFTVNAPFGKYIVRVTFMGYAPYFHPAEVSISQKHPKAQLGNMVIAPSTAALEAVVVTAQRTMVEYQLDKRVVNVDKNLVASGGTATDVLQNVPSVSVDNDGNVSLRGSSNVKVLINGRPYELMGNDLESLLEQTPASSVEAVEVITNPSAKYDPEGMSGIINIKLKDKASAAMGLNGSASLNLGTPLAFLFQGKDYPDEMDKIIPTAMATLNLNYTTEKYNIFFSADGGRRSHGHIGHSNIERKRGGTAWSHDTNDTYSVGGNTMGSVKLGGEYFFNGHNSLLASYQLRGGNRSRWGDMYSTDLLTGGLLDYNQKSESDNSNINHSVNLHYTHKFDRDEQQLTADATFSTRRMTGDGFQEQIYNVGPGGDSTAIWNNYYRRDSESENHHNALNLKLDYTHPFEWGWRMETGYEGRMDWPDQDAKYFRTDYDTATHLLRDHRYDDLSSTHFDYTQQVHAIYATFGGKIREKMSLQAGLRGEYALTDGTDLLHENTKVNKEYWKLYPTLHLSYDINKMQSLQLSYSRRVRRPHMWDLNPYMNVREGQELGFGNPNLDPEFTNAFELSYNLGFEKVNIYTSAYFRQTNNMMTRYGYVWDSLSAAHYSPWEPYNSEYDGYWASTWQNLDRGLNYGLEFIIDWQITKWWKFNVSINVYENRIEGTELLDNKSTDAFQASGKFNSFMTLPGDWTVQLSGQYMAPWLDLQTEMYASYWLDLAVKKDVLQKRGTVNLRIGDLLCTGGWGHETFTEQLSRVSRSKRLSPSVTIGFTYKIGSGLKQQQRPDASSMEEEGSGDDGNGY